MTTPTPRTVTRPWDDQLLNAITAAAAGQRGTAIHLIRQLAADHGPNCLPDVALDCIDAVLLTWGIEDFHAGNDVELEIVQTGSTEPEQRETARLKWFGDLLKYRAKFDLKQFGDTYIEMMALTKNEAQATDVTAWLVITCGHQIALTERPDETEPT